MRIIWASFIAFTTATSAFAFTAVNGLSVVPTDAQGTYDVISNPGSGPRQIWCAAAQFADFALSAQGNTRVYLVAATAKSAAYGGRRATRFTIAPDAELANAPGPNAGGSYSVSLSKIGYNLRVAHAEGFCDTIIEELFD